MALNSFWFFVIFPVLFLLYWALPAKAAKGNLRKFYLVLVSYILYTIYNPSFTLVLLFVTATTYLGALMLDPENPRYAHSRKRLIYIISILALGPLLIFKYYNFINESIRDLLAQIHLDFSLPGLNWAIPVGISFFTFQALGYLFDVYRKRELPERNFIDYALFCSFFPQMASGPISTASELLPQIKEAKSFAFSNGVQGLKWVLWGIFLKAVLADRFAIYVNLVMEDYYIFSSINCFWAAILYSLQIYCDFAGYSLMAIGIAKTLGFNLVNNFERPYFADSVTNFWRRWHISLTRWLTRHVYIPLGGSRCSRPRQYANIMATFLVSGIWHGANFTFIVWGGIHGVLQSAEKLLGIDPKGRHANKKWILRTKPLRIVITFILVTFAWIFFRMPTIGDAWNFIIRIFTAHDPQPFMFLSPKRDMALTILLIIILFVAELRAEYLREHLKWIDRPWARWTLYISLFCMILCIGVLDSSNFIYANF